MFNFLFIFIFFLAFFLLIVLVGVLLFTALRRKGKLARSLNLVLLLITLPVQKSQNEKDEHIPDKDRISIMEQLYASLSCVKEMSFWRYIFYDKPNIVFELANPSGEEDIGFYLAVPRRFLDIVDKQIHGIFPNASIEQVKKDYSIFTPDGVVVGSRLSLLKNSILPMKTYKMLESDPLSEITNSLSKLELEEGAAFQIIFRPAPFEWSRSASKVTSKMRNEGKSFDSAMAEINALGGEIKKAVGGNQQDSPMKPREQNSTYEEVAKAIEAKAAKAAFNTNIRLIASAKTQERAEDILRQMESAFMQFDSPILNRFNVKQVKKRKLRKLIYDFCFRLFDAGQSSIYNTEELTSIVHFPTDKLATPKIKSLKAVSSSPPSNLPKDGLVLGVNVFRGQETLVRMQREDRRRHLYTIGQTGVGKTVFLKNLIQQDIDNGEGVCFIDPHGSDIEDILNWIPYERVEDVIYFDPADIQRPLGLNVLEYDPAKPEQKTFAVNEVMNIFDKLYDLKSVGGPIFEQYARNAMMLVMEDPKSGSTLMEVPKVLADPVFRKYKLSQCKNIVVKDFWEKEAEKAGGDASLANMVPYITSKMNMFLSNDIMRPIICQQESTINFRKVMDEGKILLVNLSKGRLGDINSSLLGLIIVGKLLMAALSRVDMADNLRKDFYLYIDEFQNVTTDSISTILSEARKYRLNLTIAHQFIAQLADNIKNAIFGNVGSITSFRVGVEDAQFLEKYFAPIFGANDLINIDNCNAYVKLLINNQTAKPFNIQTLPPHRMEKKVAESIKELSRLKYGRPREEVEAEIAGRSRMF